jgi:hypothetical protein
LIKESIMRITAAFLSLPLIACVGNVGDGPTRGRGSGSQEGSGSATATCEDPEVIREDVVIDSVADFDALPKGCWDLDANLTIQNAAVTSLAKLGNLVAVNDLTLNGTGLTTLDSDPFIVYGSVTVVGNTKLRDLENVTLERWTPPLPVQIVIDGNAELVSLDEVAKVAHVDGDLALTNNAKLAGAAFPNLITVEGSVRIANNTALATLDLGRTSSLGTLDISNNATLTTFTGPSATKLDGNLVVRGNAKLQNLGVMSSLTQVLGHVTIENNAALANISAFSTTMQYVTGVLSISGNAQLTALGNTSRLKGIGSISITNNANLDYCEAHEVEHCVEQYSSVTINGNKQQSANNCSCWCQP